MKINCFRHSMYGIQSKKSRHEAGKKIRSARPAVICALLMLFAFVPSSPAYAIDFKEINSPLIEVFFVISFLSFLPAVLIMVTSFTRIIVVLSFLRHAFGGQQTPPNQVLIGLSLFLTFFVMSPTINVINEKAVVPYMDEELSFGEAIDEALPPLKEFMLRQTRQKDIALFAGISKKQISESPIDLSMGILVPAFAISELKTSFEIGFLLFLPFLIVDMVVASILLSMGMMMLPPVMISLPFKLLLFVLVDGWNLIIGTMMRTF